MISTFPRYVALNKDDSEKDSQCSIDLDSRETGDKPGRSWLRFLPWVLHLIFMSISATMLLKTIQIRQGLPKNSPYIKAGVVNDEHEIWRFHGNFANKKFIQSPNPELDAAFDKITLTGPSRLTEEELHKINGSIYSAQIPEVMGGGYLALPEFVHQIHCVRKLWESTYPEYFVKAYNFSIEHPEEWHDHADHCADLLVQKLMCDADVGMIPYSWLKGHYVPHPNFNVQHKCHNFDAVLAWAHKNQVDSTPLGRSEILRSDFTNEIVDYVEPPYDPKGRE